MIRRFSGSISGGLDIDAKAFLEASNNLGDSQIVSAVNNCIIELKDKEFWDKMQSFYPFVGGSSEKHKWNAKDPRDLDAAHRINWVGAIEHSSSGIKSTGGYGNTNLSNTSLTNNGGGYIYIRNDIKENALDYGSSTASNPNSRFFFGARRINEDDQSIIAPFTLQFSNINNTDSRGGYYMGRDFNTSESVYRKNLDDEFRFSTTYGNLSNQPIFICCQNSNGIPSTRTNRQYSTFVLFNQLISNSDEFHTIIQQFQIELNREI